MIEIIQSDTFRQWIHDLRDRRALDRINTRLRRVSLGNLGDTVSVGDGVSEMRIHHGPGYRLYYIRRGDRIIILLCGGDKSAQTQDIQHAKQLAKNWS